MNDFSRIVAAASVAVGCHGSAATPPPTSPEPPRVVRGFSHPESVLIHGDRLYVSNIGESLDPMAKDADGFVSELDADGNLIRLRAFAPLDGPKGSAIVSSRLYVADIDRVVGFDLATSAPVFSATSPLPKTMLNDVAMESDDTLLVTDTFGGTVHRLRISDASFTSVAAVPGANGIAVDPARGVAYVCSIGARLEGGGLFEVPLAGGEARRLGMAEGFFDGIALLGDGELLVSDWVHLDPAPKGNVIAYDRQGAAGQRLEAASVRGPADFAYDAGRRRLLVPSALEGTVTLVSLR